MAYSSASNAARIVLLLPLVTKEGLMKLSKSKGVTLSDYLRKLLAEHCLSEQKPQPKPTTLVPTTQAPTSAPPPATPWQAYISINDNVYYLGAFSEQETAELAYQAAKDAYEGTHNSKDKKRPPSNYAIGCKEIERVISGGIYQGEPR